MTYPCHFLEFGEKTKKKQVSTFWKIAIIRLKTPTKIPKIPKRTEKVLTSLKKHKKAEFSEFSTRKLTKSWKMKANLAKSAQHQKKTPRFKNNKITKKPITN